MDVFIAVSGSQSECVVFGSCGQIPHQVDRLPWSSGEEREPVSRQMGHRRRWPTSGIHSRSDISFSWE